MKLMTVFIIVIVTLLYNVLWAIPVNHNGQISGWLIEDGQKGEISQIGIRYIPEFTMEHSLSDKYRVDAELSFNTYSYTDFYDNKETEDDENFKPYRQWVRFSADHYEIRLGLQK